MAETLAAPDSTEAQALYAESVVWDGVCPYWPEGGNEIDILDYHHAHGYTVASITTAGDNHNVSEAVQMIARCRAYVRAQPDKFVFIETAEDVQRTKSSGKLGIILHLEGSECFERNLDMVEAFYRLGIRHAQLVFNIPNAAAGECAEGNEVPLSAWGRSLIAEMERVGILLDLAHTRYRSTMEAMEVSTKPVMFSHCNIGGVFKHYRNLRDDQIKGCAATGGLIGLSGSSGYLGDAASVQEMMFRHVDYVVQLIGPDHIAFGLDTVLDEDKANRWIKARPEAEWPGSRDPDWPGFRFARSDAIPGLIDIMLAHGYGDDDVRKFLGENYVRLCKEVWG